MECIFFHSWEASPCVRVSLSLCLVLLDEFRRIYALKGAEGWRLAASPRPWRWLTAKPAEEIGVLGPRRGLPV